MHRITFFTILGLGLPLGGCGESDPEESGLSAGGSGTSGISGASDELPGADSQSTAAPTTGGSGDADSATMDAGETGDATTGAATEGDSATDTDAEPDTTGGASDDTTTGESTGDPVDPVDPVDPNAACQAPAMLVPCDSEGDDIFKALGLNCSADPGTAIPIKDPVLIAPDESSYRVATRFGSAQDPDDMALPAWAPREGSRFLVIGTGKFPPLQPGGALIEEDDYDSEPNGNPDGLTQLPGAMRYQMGSNHGQGGTPFIACDGVHDCSDTLEAQWKLEPDNVANDVFYMSFDLTVPAGTHGYLFDFVFFSEEWPYYVDTSYNDMLVVWSTSETFTGNVTFIEDQPLTVTALDAFMTIKPGDPRLAGTGFPGDDEGAATGWFTAKASAQPGETFTIAVSIFDMGDQLWDSVGVLDNFRWDCEGCVPSEVDDCGIEPVPG